MNARLWQFIFFQIQWWCCILSSSSHRYHYLYLLALLLAFFDAFRHFKTAKLWILLILITSLGLINDTLLMHLNVFYFFNNFSIIIPAWLLVLWVCFGIWFLNADWINSNYLLMLLLGAIGGPLSYFAGFKLGAIFFPFPMLPTMIFIVIDWILIMLIITKLNRSWVLEKNYQ